MKKTLLLTIAIALCAVPALAFEESFESYNVGNLDYQGSEPTWIEFTDPWLSLDVRVGGSDGVRSVETHSTTTSVMGSHKYFYGATTTGAGLQVFDFWATELDVYGDVTFAEDVVWGTEFKIGNSTGGDPIVRLNNMGLGSYTANSWQRVFIEYDFNDNWLRGRLLGFDWSATTTIPIGASPANYWNRLVLRGRGFSGGQIYYDNFTQNTDCTSACTGCNYTECTYYWTTCYWNTAVQYCAVIPTAPSCSTDVNLMYCTSQGTCEAQDGIWYNGFCWAYIYQELTGFEAYYASSSASYATPTDFIKSLATSTDKFFGIVRGWTIAFGNVFNASTAQQIGSTTGSVLPQLRGWLNMANSFFNGFPIGEIVFLSLALLFATIVWKIIHSLQTFIKRW